MSGARAQDQPHVPGRAKYKDECIACFQWLKVDVWPTLRAEATDGPNLFSKICKKYE